MATVAVTSTPVTLDGTGASELIVTNVGADSAYVNTERLRPGQRKAFSTGAPLLASTVGSATTTLQVDSVVSAGTFGGAAPPAVALRTWAAAFANRHYTPAKVVAIGSSSVEGQGATVYGRHYVDMLVGKLLAQNPVAGVTGPGTYTSAYPRTNGVGSYPATYGGGTITSTSAPGWAFKTVELLAAGNTATYTFTGTSVGVVYGQFSGGGSFTATIDGGTPVTVNTNNATLDRFKVWTSAALTRGAHTLTLAWVSGRSLIRGYYAYDGNETRGFQLTNGGNYGYTTTAYQGGATPDVSQWISGIATTQPHLVLIHFGTNDYANNLGSATFRTNLQYLVNVIRTNCTSDPSFVLVAQPRASVASASEPWSAFVDAMKATAAADPKCTVVDLSTWVTSPFDDGDPLGLWNADNTHFEDKGHSLVADVLAAALVPR
jgi:lysophospholipase L1-like esterase